MKKFFSIVLTLMLLTSMFPSAAFAESVGSIGDLNVIQKPTDGKEVTPASLKVTIWNDGKEIADGGTIDPQKDMKVKIEFTLPDLPLGEDGEPDYSKPDATAKGNYMYISLPKEMSFAKQETIAMPMKAGAAEGLVMGDLTVKGSQAILVFGDDAANATYHTRGGEWEGSIQINWEQITEENKDLVFTIFGKECTVVVKPEQEESKITMSKTGEANLSEGKITWTVTISPKTGEVNYDGFEFLDTLPNTVKYIDGTFAVTGSALNGDNVKYEAESRKLSYQFPKGTTGVQTITYDTEILNLVGQNGKLITSENSASLVKDKVTAATASAVVNVTPNWIEKAGKYNVNDHSIDWTITVNESKGKLKNVVITDQLEKGLTLIQGTDSNRGPKTDIFGPIFPDDHKQEGKPYYTLSESNEMKIYLGDIDGKAVISFSTKLDNTVQANVKNTAYIHWDNEGSSIPGGNEGTGATGSAEPTISQGFISKKGGPYDFTKNVMPWTITINSAQQSIGSSRVVEIFAYNEDKVTVIKDTDVDKTKLPEKFKTRTVNVNQQYIDGSLSLEGAAPVLIDQGSPFTERGQYKLLTIDLGNKKEAQILEVYTGGLSASPETIRLNTMLTDENAYGINGRGKEYPVTNVASLHTGSTENERVVSASDTVNLKRHIIEKRLEKGYDYKDRTMTWKIDFNHNGLRITDGIITDTMPVGWDVDGNMEDGEFFELFEGSKPAFGPNPSLTKGKQITGEELKSIIESAAVTDSSNGQKLVTFKLKEISKPYVLLLKTKLTEEGANKIFANNDQNVVVSNVAKMEGSSILGMASDYEDVKISNNMLSKSGMIVSDSPGDILWTVNVNQNGIELPKDADVDEVYVVDEFKDYLVPKMIGNDYAVAIWKVDRQPNGSMTGGEALPNEEVQKLIEYDKGKNKMSIKLPTTHDAYRIQVVTRITNDDVTQVTNSVRLEGVKTNITSSQRPGGSTVVLTASAWGSVAGKIILKKTDDNTDNPKPLAGAVFKLYETSEVNGEIVKTAKYTKTTDQDGKIEFKYLKAGTYWVEEETAPVGYQKGTEFGKAVTLVAGEGKVLDVEISFVNSPLTGALQLIKTDGKGTGLKGAEFTLYRDDMLPGHVVATAVSGDNGGVIFEKASQGTYFIKETKAPDGHKLSGTVVTAVVDADGKAAYYLGTVPIDKEQVPEFVNEAYTADIVIYKKDKTNGTLLDGAEFTLYNEKGEAIGVSTTAENGLAWFYNIAYGNYTVQETKAPVGYDLNLAVAEITTGETYFNENGTRIEFTFVDQKTQTGGGENPTPDPDPDNPNPTPDPEPDNPNPTPDPEPDNPGGNTGGGGSGGGGGSSYDPPTVDIQDPDTPLAEGVEIPGEPQLPESLPQPPNQELVDLADDANPLGDKNLRDPQLPKTGGVGAGLFWILGGSLTALGAGLRKKEKKDNQDQ